MNLTFNEFYSNTGIKNIVEKTKGKSKNSRLIPVDVSTVNAVLNLTGKSQVKDFCIHMPIGESTKNSAQKAFLDLAIHLCSETGNFEKLNQANWFYTSEELIKVSDISRRFGKIKEGYYVYKDAEVTLLMIRSVKLLLDCDKENELDAFSFSFGVKDESSNPPNPPVVQWWPSLREYNPGITKEQWFEMLNDESIFNRNTLRAMAAMYDFGGAATCAQLAKKYGESADFFRNTLGTQLATKVRKRFDLPYCYNDKSENSRVWPIVFQGRKAEQGEDGSYVWKIRDELYQALTEFDILKYLGKEKMTAKEIIEEIKTYIAAKGFNYGGNLIENFFLSMKAKTFVILAGTSGTGKTKLVELFAEAIGATSEKGNGRYLLVPVRPDWSDSTDLLGHMNLNGEFVPGAIADFVYQANHDLNKPYFLCLDEMNLARVEYYLSDILSIIETRKVREDGRIGSLPLFTSNTFQSDTKIVGTEMLAKDKYENIYLSENLYIIGTVNMDETTFPFSKKVLDRANTIEFSKVDTLVPDFDAIFQAQGNVTSSLVGINNDFLKAKYTKIEECSDMKDTVIADCKELQALNVILEKAEAHVGYRVRDEIEFYLLYSREDGGIIPLNEAFDNEIMQKILPRIQGSGMEVLKLIESLITFCDGKYPKSKAKLEAMKARCGEYGEGYTSYWL